MNGWNIFVIAVIVIILGLAVAAIFKSKKSGKTCMGCPDSCACSRGNCNGGCTGCEK